MANSQVLSRAGNTELHCPRKETISRRMHYSLCRKMNIEWPEKVGVE